MILEKKMGKSWQINVLAQAIITRSLFLLPYSHYLLISTLFEARVITSKSHYSFTSQVTCAVKKKTPPAKNVPMKSIHT